MPQRSEEAAHRRKHALSLIGLFNAQAGSSASLSEHWDNLSHNLCAHTDNMACCIAARPDFHLHVPSVDDCIFSQNRPSSWGCSSTPLYLLSATTPQSSTGDSGLTGDRLGAAMRKILPG